MKAIVVRELRKQGLILGAAICLMIGCIAVSVQATIAEGPKVAALYLVYLIFLPILGSISGSSVYSGRLEPSAGTLAEKRVFAGVSVRLIQVIAAVALTVFALIAPLNLCRYFSVSLWPVLPDGIRDWSGGFLDLVYLFSDFPTYYRGKLVEILIQFYGRPGMFLLGIPLSLVCFSCAILFASLLYRGTIAAIAGWFTGTAVSALIFHFWLRLEFSQYAGDTTELSPMGQQWIAWVLTLAAMFIFLFPKRRFSNPNRRVWGAIVLGAFLCSGMAALAFFAVAYPHGIRLSPASAYAYRNAQLTSNGANVVLEAGLPDSLAPEIWAIPLNGKGFTRLTGRLANKPAVSPEGIWVAYLSQRDILGLARASIDLRAVRFDGSRDHLLAPGVAENPDFITEVSCGDLAFSPDGRKVALVCAERVIVADASGARTVCTDLPAEFCWHSQVVWNASGSEVLISPDAGFCEGRGPLLAYNPTSGVLRTVSKHHLDRQFILPSDASKGVRYALAGDSLEDVETGVAQKIAEADCYAAGISSDERFLAYIKPLGSGWFDSSEVHRREISSGEDEVVASLQIPYMKPALFSPKGDRIAVCCAGAPGAYQSFVYGRNGTLRFFEPGWMVLGWVNNDEVALIGSGPRTDYGLELKVFPIVVAEIATGKTRIIHP